MNNRLEESHQTFRDATDVYFIVYISGTTNIYLIAWFYEVVSSSLWIRQCDIISFQSSVGHRLSSMSTAYVIWNRIYALANACQLCIIYFPPAYLDFQISKSVRQTFCGSVGRFGIIESTWRKTVRRQRVSKLT